jgi:diadenosine tetraphosphate (Ap4A) HIT family hydrolase
MALIYKTPNFTVEAFDTPHIDRNDGGHIKISPNIKIINRQQLSPKLAIECTRLTIIVGQAMTKIMNEHGVDIGRINYQDNGNWSVFSTNGPYFHIHLYGRAKSAKIQKYGEAVFFPTRSEHPEFYEKFKSLNTVDIKDIKVEIERLMKENKFSDSKWKLI